MLATIRAKYFCAEPVSGPEAGRDPTLHACRRVRPDGTVRANCPLLRRIVT